MLYMLNYIRDLVGISQNQQPTTRKRRHLDDLDYGSFKIKRLNNSNMYNSTFADSEPSSSSRMFKKPTKRCTKFYNTNNYKSDVIDFSDDDDVIEVNRGRSLSNGSWIDTKVECRPVEKLWPFERKRQFKSVGSLEETPASIIQRGRASIKNSNRVLSPLNRNKLHFRSSALNESFRIQDKLKYQEMLMNVAPAASTYSSSFDDSFHSAMSDQSKIYNNSRTRKIMSLLRNNPIQTIDLTEQDCAKSNDLIVVKDSSDSETEGFKPKIEPLNTMKKLLETEPIMHENWLQNWNERQKSILGDKERLILEEKMKRDKFKEVNSVNVESYLQAKVRSCLQLKDIVEPIQYADVVEVPVLPELTSRQEDLIDDALRSEPKSQVLVEKFNLRISRADIHTLKGLNWLNDEVINFYMNLLIERGQQKDMPKVHAMNTFFYPKLLSNGYSSLRRWTKRVDIFAQEYLVVPIHLGVHWCMAIINFQDKTIKYYDSMGGNNQKCLEALFNYLKDEHMDKKKAEFDSSGWSKTVMKNIPQQMNGSDCGMFSCMYAEFITRNARITFTQEHMSYFRRKMILEIVTGKLLINHK